SLLLSLSHSSRSPPLSRVFPSTTLFRSSSSIFTILATSVALVSLNWRFLLILVVVTPIYVIASRRYLAVAPERYAAERASMADRARRLLEAIHGRATVRAYRMEEEMHERIRVTSQAVVDHGFSARLTMIV